MSLRPAIGWKLTRKQPALNLEPAKADMLVSAGGTPTNTKLSSRETAFPET
jgi:hypothetical protein